MCLARANAKNALGRNAQPAFTGIRLTPKDSASSAAKHLVRPARITCLPNASPASRGRNLPTANASLTCPAITTRAAQTAARPLGTIEWDQPVCPAQKVQTASSAIWRALRSALSAKTVITSTQKWTAPSVAAVAFSARVPISALPAPLGSPSRPIRLRGSALLAYSRVSPASELSITALRVQRDSLGTVGSA